MCLCAASWTAATSLWPPRWRRRWSPSNQRSAASATTKEPRSCWRIWTSRHFLCQRIRDCDLICSCKWECFQEVDTSWNTMVWFQSLMEKWTQVCVRILCGNNQIKDKVKLRENRLKYTDAACLQAFFPVLQQKNNGNTIIIAWVQQQNNTNTVVAIHSYFDFKLLSVKLNISFTLKAFTLWSCWRLLKWNICRKLF